MRRAWLRSLFLIPLGLLLVLTAVGRGALPVAAQEDGAWSAPLRISGPDPRAAGWFPAITVDIYGHVHVVWNGRAPRRPGATTQEASQRISDAAGWLIYAHLDGQRWSPPTEIAAIGDEGDALRSSLTSDQSGQLHLLYRGLDLRDPKIGGAENEPMRHSTVDALQAEWPSSWTAGAQFSRRTPAYFPDVVTDNHGVLHALTTEADAKSKYTVYYRRSDDRGKTWNSSTAIETDLAVSRWRAQLKVGPNDDLHAVWEVVDAADPSSRVPVGFVYARSTDGGQTWTKKVFAPPQQDFLYPKQFEGTRWRVQPAVGVDGRGQIVLVWREFETSTVYFQRSVDGVEWTPPSRVGGITRGVDRPFDRYDMALDGAGRLHLVLVAYPDDSPIMSLLHSEWLGYSWSTPDVITRAAKAPYPEWPRIAISEGNRLHVAWFGGNLPTVDRVPIGILYSSKLLEQPALPVAPLPARGASSGPVTTPQMLAPTPVGPTTSVAASTPMGTAITRSSQPVGNVELSPLPVMQGLAVAATVLLVFLLSRVLLRGGLRR